VDFVAGVGFRFFACGFRLISGGFRGFRLLAGPLRSSACSFRGDDSRDISKNAHWPMFTQFATLTTQQRTNDALLNRGSYTIFVAILC